MAVTVEGVFLLVDRASDALRRIERQAERTDKALRGTGDSMDKISEPRTIRNMERMDRQMRNMERDSGKLDQSFQRTERSAGLLDNKLIRLGASLAAISRIIAIMKWPVFIAGAGLAAQGIGALGGAVVGLLPALGEMSGVMAALPATLIGIGGAAITTKLALGGVSEALGGNREAMRELTPQAREFVRTLKDLEPLVNRLRQTAQRGLLPGLTQAVGTLAERGAPTAQRLVGRFGRTAGRAAERGAQRMTRPGVLRDIELLGGQGDRIFGRMTRGALNLADALRNIAVAARPFTEWLSKTVLGWTEMLRTTTRQGRETGKLADFFDRVRERLEQVFTIAGNLWRTFGAILRAARPLSDFIFKFFEGATGRWEEFTNSSKGQQRMRRWFNAIRPPLRQFFGLIGDIFKVWVDLTERGGGRQGALTRSLRGLRDIAKPLGRLLGDAADALGPAFIDALTEFVELLGNVPWRPMEKVLNFFTWTLDKVNKLIEKVPILGEVLSVLVAGGAIAKLIGGGGPGGGGGGILQKLTAGLGGLLSRRGGAAGKVGGVLSRASAVPVWVVNQVGGGVPIGGPGGGGGGWRARAGRLATRAAPFLRAAAPAAGLVLSAGAMAWLYNKVNKDLPTGAGSGEGGSAAPVQRAAEGRPQPGVGLPGADIGPQATRVGVTRAMAMRPGETPYIRARGLGASIIKDEAAAATAVSRGHRRQGRAHKELRDEQDKTKQNHRELTDDMIDRTKRATERSEARLEALRKAFNRKTTDMKQVTTRGFSSIHSEMLKYLSRIQGGNAPGTTGLTPGPSGQLRPGARGMRIPGKGLRDTVPIAPGAIAAPGELVVNRHTEADVDRDLRLSGRPTLGRRVASETRPHNAPGRGPGHAHIFHARGGRVPDAMGALPGLDVLAAWANQKFGVGVSSGLRPGAITTSGNASDHGWGGAVDLSNGASPTPQMDALSRTLGRLGGGTFTAGVFSGGPIKQMIYRSMVGGNHFNHVHVALQQAFANNAEAVTRWLGGAGGLRGMLAGMGGAAPKLKMPGAYDRGRGLRGRASLAALRRTRRRAQRRLNNAYGSGASGGDLGAGISGSNQTIGHKMMLRMGWGESQWPALKELWDRESGWRNVMNTAGSGATGIPQALPGSKMASEGADWATNPKTQIAWGLKYIKGRYGSPSAALAFHTANNWYARGGRMGGTLTVGDSLGVGTNPYLQDILRGGVTSDATVGRSSASGIGAMRGLIGQGDYDRILLDLGTNDASAGQLRASIRQARRMAGGIPIYVPTVRGPAAAQKNAMLRRMDRRGLINTIDWAGQSEGLLAGDSIHATPQGYQARARMIAGSFAGGGRIPWFGEGGDFVARRPMVIGVGDSPGGERVQVTPAGRGGRGGGPLIGTMHINNKQPGDVRNQIVREVRGALRTVRRELDQAGVEDGDLA